MPIDGTYTAVIDRFEEEHAVLLLEDNDETVGEAVVDTEQLPEDARHVDAVLSVEFEEGDLVEMAYLREETTDRSGEAQSRFDDLSQRPPSQDEDDNSP